MQGYSYTRCWPLTAMALHGAALKMAETKGFSGESADVVSADACRRLPTRLAMTQKNFDATYGLFVSRFFARE
jgi:hypothetical protein